MAMSRKLSKRSAELGAVPAGQKALSRAPPHYFHVLRYRHELMKSLVRFSFCYGLYALTPRCNGIYGPDMVNKPHVTSWRYDICFSCVRISSKYMATFLALIMRIWRFTRFIVRAEGAAATVPRHFIDFEIGHFRVEAKCHQHTALIGRRRYAYLLASQPLHRNAAGF